MNNSRLLSRSIILFALFLSMSCCDRKESITSPQAKEAPYVVSVREALEVAKMFSIAPEQGSNPGAKGEATSTVVSQETIIDEVDQKPVLHIMNRVKGFIIISADLRIMPVIAYSDKSQFDIKQMPAGVKLWLESAKLKIKDVKRLKINADSTVINEWKKYLTGTLNLPHSGGRVSNTNCYEY